VTISPSAAYLGRSGTDKCVAIVHAMRLYSADVIHRTIQPTSGNRPTSKLFLALRHGVVGVVLYDLPMTLSTSGPGLFSSF
jgi:hypothetical protein